MSASFVSRSPSKLVYGLAIFSSAFLLFQVQPLIAKIILPWFGGGAAVWIVCLLFFQLVLLLGYLLRAFFVAKIPCANAGANSCGDSGRQFAGAADSAQETPGSHTGPDAPVIHILLLLGVTVGLPYFLLSATSPLLQAVVHANARGRCAVPLLRAV